MGTQVISSILIANEDILVKGPLGGFEGDVIESADPGGFVAKWDFNVNSSIIQVHNYIPLQQAQKVDQLEVFMQEYSFDIAFFMNPQPDGYFHQCASCPDSSENYCQANCLSA